MSGNDWAGAAIAGIAAAYAVGSRRLATTPLSAGIVFAGVGVAIGPIGLDLVNLQHDQGPLLDALEAALTLVLFTDAMSVPLSELRTETPLPARLLSMGLLLTVGVGWLLAWPLLPGLTAWELALLAAILAPTDAALGESAIENPRVPSLIRRTLNIESGLNDGLVLPFFVLFLAAIPGTSYAEEGLGGTFWRALVLSTVIGFAVGWIGGWLMRLSYRHGWISPEWAQILFLALAAGSYALATVTKGSGFIAAWVAGFALAGALHRESPPLPEQARTAGFAEYLGQLLAMLSLLFFGAVLLGPALEHLSWRMVVYAVLSLTVIRMVPVALSLIGSGLKPPSVAYIGWFGPRGLASIVLGLLAAEQHVPGMQLIGQVAAVTIGLSIVLHGASAVGLSNRYGRWFERTGTT